ncbi:MAG: hypothetical protein ABS46_20695 [Cytophagaceae bacterium SCN 52-12]|nr:MAG: hypothetical protein ABS46_20695 [Cytophagaceae bacterium SCN 52-12]
MKTTTKRSRIALALTMAGILCGCTEFLRENDPNRITADNYFTTPEGLRDAVNGIYSPARSFIGQEEGYSVVVFGTDMFTEASDESASWNSKQFNRYSSDLNARSEKIEQIWQNCYKGVNNANTAIGRAENVAMDEAQKNRLIAEARYLRAYYYFWLVRMYGPVPVKLHETKGVELDFGRGSETDVLTAVIDDLLFAAEHLDAKSAEWGRPSRWAARHFLALAYLTRAKDSNDYQLALANAQEVINNSQHILLPAYADLWKLDNQQNQEIIWSIQFSPVESNNGGAGNRGHLFFLMEYDLATYHMQRDVENGRPFKRFRPTEHLLGLFADNDPRYDATFKTVWYCNSAQRLPSDGSLHLGDTCIYLPKHAMNPAAKASRPYAVINPDQYSPTTFPSVRKFDQPDRVDAADRDGSRDFIVFRLAETYLIAAEAAFRLNGTGAEYLNKVRARAQQPPLAQISIDAILDENAREFAGEGKRWFDLVRTGKLIERVRKYNPGAAAENIRDYHVRRPIPQSEIDIIHSDLFKQNEGYN